ncbi:MAG: biotin transporter BioY [Anaerolineae bacterium]|nr:biotin transporter BioY [Anaerolineae bacterium]MDW8172264.1 biotin transporter BioY [Anaerolineae bacterium]
MLRTLTNTPHHPATTLSQRLAWVLAFIVLTALSSRVSIPLEPVPFTLQVLVVLLSGLVLGARDGALSQLGYVGLIALGLPLDARGLGSAALFGPTGGFLMGFIISAGLVGWLAERGAQRLAWRWLAGLAGVAIIYLFGVLHLAAYADLTLERAWELGAQPFVLLDVVKALLAAGLTETLRAFLSQSRTKG